MDVLNVIQTVGFPIACVLGLSWFIYMTWKKNAETNQKQMNEMAERCQKREDKLYEQIDKFNDTMNNFNTTLIRIDTRLEVLEKNTKEKESLD